VVARGDAKADVAMSGNGAGQLAVVYWTYPDGKEGHGAELPLEQAKEMERVYARQYPDRRYVVRLVNSGAASPGTPKQQSAL
jgi:hypothetical protein